MSEGKILCDLCNSMLLQYYPEGYKGKCPIYDTDLPLE